MNNFKWRDPDKELPNKDQLVFAMLDPHKWRGSLRESVPSIQIVAGSFWGGRVENDDEYGLGSQAWEMRVFNKEMNYREHFVIAWIPAEEMPLPDFIKNRP